MVRRQQLFKRIGTAQREVLETVVKRFLRIVEAFPFITPTLSSNISMKLDQERMITVFAYLGFLIHYCLCGGETCDYPRCILTLLVLYGLESHYEYCFVMRFSQVNYKLHFLSFCATILINSSEFIQYLYIVVRKNNYLQMMITRPLAKIFVSTVR